MKSFRLIVIFLAPILMAAGLRFPRLAERPMHCDEAVQADKFGTLLESGRYKYSTEEFHGPTLNYLTLLPARLQGATTYGELSEVTLRSVPATLGVLLVGAHLLLIPLLGAPAAVAGAVLAAVSPAMVFYSRYYIHETLLVFFSFGLLISLCRYLQRQNVGWALGGGVCLGLMYATKETWIISAAALFGAIVLTRRFERWRGQSSDAPPIAVSARHALLAASAAILVSGLLFTSFLSNRHGIMDSLLAWRTYVARALSASWHFHPWHYYIGLLSYSHSKGGPVWTEGSIIALAMVGFIAGLGTRGIRGVDIRMLRFVGFYTLLMVSIYSMIPYKTPWCLLGFLHGMILLAGAGAVHLLNSFRRVPLKLLLIACLSAATLHLGWQAWAGSFRFDADPRNPYVYAHTGKDVFALVDRVQDLARAHPDGSRMPIQIISRENLWPLPWYLRRFTGVSWWNGVPEQAPNAPLILATPNMEPALIRKLYELPPPGEKELYMNIFERRLELRPQVELRGYAAKSLWDEYLQLNSKSPSRSESRR